MSTGAVHATATTPVANPSLVLDVAMGTMFLPAGVDAAITDALQPDLGDGISLLTDPGPPSPRNGPHQFSPDPPTQTESAAVSSQPSAAVPIKGAFNIKGVHGGFINKATVQYWNSIPGGEKWVNMVQAYIDLERMPPTNAVCHTLFLDSVSIIDLYPGASAPLPRVPAMRGRELVEKPKILKEACTCCRRRPQVPG